MEHQVFIDFNRPVRTVTVESCQLPSPSHEELSRMLEESYQKGIAAGRAQSQKLVDQAQKELATIRDEVIPSLQKEIDAVLLQLEDELPTLILQIMRGLIASVEWKKEDVLAILRSTIEEISSPGETLTVYLSPADLQLVQTTDENILGKPLEIIWKEDSTLQRGDCIVRSRFGIIDAQMDTKLKKIHSQLE